MPDLPNTYSGQDLINRALSGSGVPTDLPFTPIGAHTSQNNLSTARTLTPPNPTATKLLVQCITQNVRYTLDGTTPTSTLGFRLVAGDSPYIIPVAVGNTVKFIEETATAVLQTQWGS